MAWIKSLKVLFDRILKDFVIGVTNYMKLNKFLFSKISCNLSFLLIERHSQQISISLKKRKSLKNRSPTLIIFRFYPPQKISGNNFRDSLNVKLNEISIYWTSGKCCILPPSYHQIYKEILFLNSHLQTWYKRMWC